MFRTLSMAEYNNNQVAEFVQLTGCNIAEAEVWLDMTGNDVGQAVDLYFNNDQGGMQSSTNTTNKNPQDDFSATDYNTAGFGDEQEVRKGDDVITSNLLGSAPIMPNHGIVNADHVRALQQQYQATLYPSQQQATAGSSGDGNVPMTVFGNVHGTKREQTLASMYKINAKLLYRGDFAQAREYAKKQDQWLLVSIHADDEFACHVLNRDVWADELVEDVVRSSFVFWYREDKSPDGRFYIERYKVAGAPYLGFIDPRTGGLVKVFVGPKGVPNTAMGMVERCKLFLKLHFVAAFCLLYVLVFLR